MRTGARYYPRSTVVPVVVPVFWSLVPTRYLTNFLYELEVGQTPAEKPESGRVCGPKGSPKVLLGRLGGRGKVRPNAKKNCFFYFLSPQRIFSFFWSFFCSSLSPPVSRLEWWSLSFVLRASHCIPAPQTSQSCGPYPPPPSCTFCHCRAHP